MRRLALATAALSVLATTAAPAQPRPPAGRTGAPPHAFLFGSWTGGLFPVVDSALQQNCRTQPTVVFAQDVVAHGTLIGSTLAQRVIETVRTSPTGAEFRFAPDADDPAGFGCDDANTLHVQRDSDTRISFPRCAAFPYPLERCPIR